MPTCDNKAKPTSLGSLTASELDHHASEAAKVKRTKEQAYFNSYDFDAIEVLPYDEDEKECSHHHVNHSGRYSKYNSDVCTSCHQSSQLASVSSDPDAIISTVSHSHSLNSPSHHNQQQQLKKKKKESTSSHCSSHSSSSLSSFTNPNNSVDTKRTYLKRIGAFLTSHSIGKRSSIDCLANVECHNQENKLSSASSQDGLNADVKSKAKLFDSSNTTTNGSIKRDNGKDENGNSNFLLPRPMLKYQSVGFGNSMPLTVSTNQGDSSPSLKSNSINVQINQVTNNSPNSNTQPNTVESSTAAIEVVAHNKTNLHKPQNLITNKSTLKNSGFISSSLSSSSSSASVSTSSLAKSLLTTSSLSAESSSIIGETSANVDVSRAQALVSAAAAPVASKVITNPNDVSSITNDLQQRFDEKLVLTSSSSSSIAPDGGTIADGGGMPNSSSRSTTNAEDAAATGHSDSRGARERTSSQSHYSTDKSGSSGYYSSNVCSTYSVEDHIYCEPVIDILEVSKPDTSKSSKLGQQSVKGHRKIMIVNNSDDDDDDHHNHRRHRRNRQQQQHVKQNLRILESSIENLDRHLKNYPKMIAQDRLASYIPSNPQTIPTHFFQMHSSNSTVDTAKNRYGHLPTIMEGGTNDISGNFQKSWQEEIAEDSLLDIDLDSFLLASSEAKNKSQAISGIDNPTFNKSEILNDEDMENHYKCAKYINSCPEDAYKLESEVGNSVDHFLKKYDDQIHFQNTRELLEDVRDKIRLLSESSEGITLSNTVDGKNLPHELDTMINALKSELESYLERMNHHSEMEIRQLCTGLVKNQNIVRMKKAFERRKSNASESEYDFAYEAVRDGTSVTVQHTQQHIEMTSIRCSSDPNFKMKRKSLSDIFPKMDAVCYMGTSGSGLNRAAGGVSDNGRESVLNGSATSGLEKTQLQRNLSFHKPVLNKLDGEAHEDGDKDSIMDWHQKKPSNWEMYYGTNRMNQTLLGKRGVITNGNQMIMSYPSSRPESDFTLDLPRAEQLRIKMEKEKKFRRRCRYLTTFLSLVFFLLTVMVVSLVLTRGKRMFGSMI